MRPFFSWQIIDDPKHVILIARSRSSTAFAKSFIVSFFFLILFYCLSKKKNLRTSVQVKCPFMCVQKYKKKKIRARVCGTRGRRRSCDVPRIYTIYSVRYTQRIYRTCHARCSLCHLRILFVLNIMYKYTVCRFCARNESLSHLASLPIYYI